MMHIIFSRHRRGAKPIYSDKETLSLKYEKQYKLMKKSIIGIIALIIACVLGINFTSILQNTSALLRGLRFVLYMASGAGIGILIPFAVCTVMAHKKIGNK